MQTTIYKPEDEQKLMSVLWSPTLRDNPLAFVKYLFPWGVKGTPLEHFSGPRKWQREVLQDITDHIAANNNLLTGGVNTTGAKSNQLSNQEIAYKVLQEAISSGRGIGKSALVSWLTIWMVSTRIGSTTIISANSENQLRSITWAEITKWLAMGLNSHWFEVSATKVAPAKWLTDLVEQDLKKGTRY